MQLPMLEMYSTLSATTKPTGKNRFEAGMYGNTISATPNRTVFRHGYLLLPVMPKYPSAVTVTIAATVARFQGLVKEEMAGIAPMRQSHVRSEGCRSNHELTKVR